MANTLILIERNIQEIHLVTSSKISKTKSAQLQLKQGDGTFIKITANKVMSNTRSILRQPVTFKSNGKFEKIIEGFHLVDTIPLEKELDMVRRLIESKYYLDVKLPDIL